MPKAKKIKIGPHVMPIRYIADLRDGDKSLFGAALYRQCEIHIEKNLAPSRQAQAIIHESLHQMDVDYELKLKEEQIVRLATAFTCLLRDNKHLFGSALFQDD